MLKYHKISPLFQRYGFSEEAIAVIKKLRASELSRRVKDIDENVCVCYVSNKMGRTIQKESRLSELPSYLCEIEHDDNTLKFYDQSPLIKIGYHVRGDSTK